MPRAKQKKRVKHDNNNAKKKSIDHEASIE